MKNSFNIILAMFLTLFLLDAHAAFLKNPRNIEGTYVCVGHDPFANINYHGKTTVTKTGQSYRFKWDFGKKMIFNGTGIFNRNEAKTLAVVFSNPNNPKYTGVQIYRIKANGTLEGNWTILGKDKVGSEVCEKSQ